MPCALTNLSEAGSSCPFCLEGSTVSHAATLQQDMSLAHLQFADWNEDWCQTM